MEKIWRSPGLLVYDGRMKIVLDKTRVQAAIVAVPVLIVAAIGLYYYFFIRPTYGIFHEAFLARDTAVRAVFKPVLVQSYVSSLAPTGSRLVRGVPRVSSLQQFAFRTEWIHKMPFEFTFLLDQRSPDHLGVLLFVREHPAAEAFDSLVNDTGFFTALHPIRWEQRRVSRQGAGQLIAAGTLPIPTTARNAVSQHWPTYQPVQALPVTGRHFIEIAVNNRNGALMELHGALMRAVQVWADAGLEQEIHGLWPVIEEARLTGDLDGADQLRFTVSVLCATAEAARDTADAMSAAAYKIDQYLDAQFGFTLNGAVQASGDTVRGEYTLTDFEPRLRRALGG